MNSLALAATGWVSTNTRKSFKQPRTQHNKNGWWWWWGFGKNGQIFPGQILPEQMSPWQLESVLVVPRKLHLKFHQNWVSNSWDIPDIDKCHKDKCCDDSCNLFYMFPGHFVQSLIQIGPVTAEILLILTNFPRTNNAWTNFVVTIVICCICSQDPSFKVWSKSGQ